MGRQFHDSVPTPRGSTLVTGKTPADLLPDSLNGKLRNDNQHPILFQAIASVPSFELWLLLHYESIQATIHRDEVMRRLRLHIPEYEKGATRAFSITQQRLPVAMQRGQALATKYTAYSAPDFHRSHQSGAMTHSAQGLRAHGEIDLAQNRSPAVVRHRHPQAPDPPARFGFLFFHPISGVIPASESGYNAWHRSTNRSHPGPSILHYSPPADQRIDAWR